MHPSAFTRRFLDASRIRREENITGSLFEMRWIPSRARLSEYGVTDASWESDEGVCEGWKEFEVKVLGVFEGGVC